MEYKNTQSKKSQGKRKKVQMEQTENIGLNANILITTLNVFA